MSSDLGEVWGIVLAAGGGARFGGLKQFVPIHGRRLVDRVVDVVVPLCSGVVVVLPPATEWGEPRGSTVVGGGTTRSGSVRVGLAAVPDSAGIVVVHDAAHPLASRELFLGVIDAVRDGADAAAPALPLDDPIKRADRSGAVTETIDRTDAYLLQTPHAFRASLLREVHAGQPEVAEETELIEHHGGRVVLIPGEPWNLHVTTPAHVDVVTRLLAPPVPSELEPARARPATLRHGVEDDLGEVPRDGVE